VIVIPMVGNSKRFFDVGISKPKWSLHVGKDSMLIWALKTVESLAYQSERIVLIVKTQDYSFLQEALKSVTHDFLEVVCLDHSTKGQAITVFEGISKLNVDRNDRLLVWCSDSYIKDASSISFAYQSNHLVLAKMEGTQWSFARTEDNLVLETAEKVRISNLASVGLYNFESISEYLSLDFYEESESERFVAPLYNQMINKGKEVQFTEILSEQFFSFGTPQELIHSAKRLEVVPDSQLSHIFR
jgi:dTDP-glucose pyrophosphorylase